MLCPAGSAQDVRQRLVDGGAKTFRGPRSAQIRGQTAWLPRLQNRIDGSQNGIVSGAMPQEIEHHGASPYLSNGIGHSSAGDVGRRTVHGLEERRVATRRIEVGTRSDADSARTGRSQIAQDVTEQVAGHHDIEELGALDEMGCQNVDMNLSTTTSGYCPAMAATRSSQ